MSILLQTNFVFFEMWKINKNQWVTLSRTSSVFHAEIPRNKFYSLNTFALSMHANLISTSMQQDKWLDSYINSIWRGRELSAHD